jgi:hypothetical protein
VTLSQKVQAVLIASSPVTVIVPSSRIKPPGDWQSIPRPWIKHQPIGVDPQYVSGGVGTPGLIPLKEWIYQVSCFADSFSGAEALADIVINALNGLQTDVQFNWNGYDVLPFEEDVKVQHIALTFQVWGVL